MDRGERQWELLLQQFEDSLKTPEKIFNSIMKYKMGNKIYIGWTLKPV